jgi:GNAT superfamily N-acetyltransferase
VIVRPAAPADAGLLARHRAAVWAEGGKWSAAELTPQIAIWSAFFHTHLVGATYANFIAEADGVPRGSGGILIYTAIPRPGLAADRAGRVQSVYVEPAARRAGIARAIMERLIAHAREVQLISLALHPSDAARPLYAALGFEPADEMLLRFTRG